MSTEGVSGMAVVAATGGIVLVWSGVKGASISKTLQSLVTGQQPSSATANPITSSFTDTSTSGSTGTASTSASLSGITGSNRAILQQVAATHGWTGAQWTALDNVEMREAGYSLTATNPSSGAYGMAQFINGASEYATYGGNSTTALGQSIAMCNYIEQRYGTPAAAWAHEQSAGWY